MRNLAVVLTLLVSVGCSTFVQSEKGRVNRKTASSDDPVWSDISNVTHPMATSPGYLNFPEKFHRWECVGIKREVVESDPVRRSEVLDQVYVETGYDRAQVVQRLLKKSGQSETSADFRMYCGSTTMAGAAY